MTRFRQWPLAMAAGALLGGSALTAHAQASQVKDVFYISMENTNWTQAPGQSIQQIFGNSAAPWLNSLVAGTLPATVDGLRITTQTAYANAYHNVLSTPTGSNAHIHPSEPNYIWAEGGTNYGVLNDNQPYGSGGTNQNTTQHLSSYLLATGQTVRSYQEGVDLARNASGQLTNTVLPRDQWISPIQNSSGSSPAYVNPYNGSNQFDYAAKHNPMVFFSDTNGGNNATSSNPAAKLYAPLEQLQADLINNAVARYNWITPDQFNDMHSGLAGGFTYNGTTYAAGTAAEKIAQGDSFLSKIIPMIMSSQAYQDNGAIVLWWDESEGANADSFATTIPEIVISKLAHPNVGGVPYASLVNMTHSDDLRTLQNLFGVNPQTGFAYLGDAANGVGIDDLFAPGAVAAVPEPESYALMLAGLGMIGLMMRRRARR
jgi:hypothetical protein